MLVTAGPRLRLRFRIIGALAAAIALLVAAATVHAAPRRPPPPRPDLELTSASVTPRVVFQAEPRAQVRFCVEVRNVGRRRSGRIVATMKVEGPGVSAVLATRSLAPLTAPTRPRRGAPLEFDSVRGCDRFGTLTDFGPTGRLTLDYLKGTYEAVGRVRGASLLSGSRGGPADAENYAWSFS